MRDSFLVRLAVGIVFFVSGSAALVYEILWSRQFVTVFGNSAYAISIVLCAFMAGLGVGSLYFGRRADRTADPLRMYALLELGIAATALAIPWLVELLRAFTPALFAALPSDVVSVGTVRLVFTFLVLFVPCCLIGGTLPVLARFCVDSNDVVGQRIGLLYGLNTLGGATGCFLAGYWLIETLGVAATGYVAVGANVAIALTAFAIRAARGPRVAPPGEPAALTPSVASHAVASEASPAGGLARILLLVAFLSGFSTLACEVLWARYLSFVCHSNPYTFTAILGFFLVGLALGSLIYRTFLARLRDRVFVLGVVQLAIGVAVLATLLVSTWYLVSHGPSAREKIIDSLVAKIGFQEQRVFLWSLTAAALFVFVPTLVMGIVFPLLCAAYTRSMGTVGRSIGLVYGLNTAGCIVGSLAPVFFLVPTFGIQNSLAGLAVLNAAIGLLLLVRARRTGTTARRPYPVYAAGGVLLLLLVTAFAAPKDLTQRIFLQGVQSVGPQSEIVHYGEGRTGSAIVVRDKIDGMYDLYVNSVNEVPTTYLAQGIFRLMGHLGPLLHPDPRECLVICFGGGIAGGALNLHSAVQSLDIVDIEGSVVEAARVLKKENNDLHASEKLTIHVEDGRNYLLTCGRQYPVILCDSTHPKAADSWVLYTKEYYEIVDASLEDPGVFIQWLPYHGISESEFKIITRTFQSVFPETSIWMVYGHNERGTVWGHTLLVGMKPRLTIDLDLFARRLADPKVHADLAPFEMDTPLNLLRHFVCGPERLREWTAGFPINTDDMPVTQYYSNYSIGHDGNRPSHHLMFAGLLESPWPWLENVDPTAVGSDLRDRLDLCMEARALSMRGKWADARALLPDDEKMGLFEGIILQGRRWQARKRELYPSK